MYLLQVISFFVFIMELIQPMKFKYAVLIGIDIDMFYTNTTDGDEGTEVCKYKMCFTNRN
jgi:hypothetical protein